MSSREVNRKSQKLSPFVKHSRTHGGKQQLENSDNEAVYCSGLKEVCHKKIKAVYSLRRLIATLDLQLFRLLLFRF